MEWGLEHRQRQLCQRADCWAASEVVSASRTSRLEPPLARAQLTSLAIGSHSMHAVGAGVPAREQ